MVVGLKIVVVAPDHPRPLWAEPWDINNNGDIQYQMIACVLVEVELDLASTQALLFLFFIITVQ